jgi:hypothetical protein
MARQPRKGTHVLNFGRIRAWHGKSSGLGGASESEMWFLNV